FFVDNRPGAASNLAAEAALRAPADGHTLFVASGANAVNATLFKGLSFDFIRDSTAVAGIKRIPILVAVHPPLSSKTVSELMALAKTSQINVATTPKGTAPSMAAALFKLSAGVDIALIAYRGDAQALTDLLGGQVPAAFGGISAWIEHIRSGNVRALA